MTFSHKSLERRREDVESFSFAQRRWAAGAEQAHAADTFASKERPDPILCANPIALTAQITKEQVQ